MRKFSFIVLIPLILVAGQQKKNPEYIILSYLGGGAEKPIPTIVFYVDSFTLNEDSIYYLPIYKVSKCEFLSIKYAIEESNVSTKIDNTNFGFYNFIIASNAKKICYKTDNTKTTKILFDEIQKQVSKNKKFKSVKYYFENIIARIESINKKD